VPTSAESGVTGRPTLVHDVERARRRLALLLLFFERIETISTAPPPPPHAASFEDESIIMKYVPRLPPPIILQLLPSTPIKQQDADADLWMIFVVLR